jgi:hypothetical protein
MTYKKIVMITAFLGLLVLAAGEAPPGKKVPQMSKEELKPKLGSKDLIIIDVRLDEQWRFSNRKIPGAVHENPAVPTTWMNKYPKDKTIVFY